MSTKRDSKGRFVGSPVASHSFRRVDLDGKQLRSALVAEAERARRALPKAAIAAARRFVRLLVELTDEMGITDRGILKNSWRADRTTKGAQTFSDAPHAGVIELGARPHPVSEEAVELIAQWAERKLGLDPIEAMEAAKGIANKIRARGQEPRYLVRDAIPQAKAFFAQEFARVMKTEPARKPARR